MKSEPSETKPTMTPLSFDATPYRTPEVQVGWEAATFPSFAFYRRFAAIVLRSSALAKRGGFGDEEWCSGSLEVMRALEAVGVRIEITGLHHLAQLQEPCVIIGNHMSALESFVLPSVIRPFRSVTFVVKESLLRYPVFRHIMRSRNPVAVGRTNPRQDLKNVLAGGAERLGAGISLVVFPQTTRTDRLEPKEFNTIGVKLAQRSGVPILPLALLTDAWGTGKHLKDFGRIDPSKKVRLAFGEPLRGEGRGVREHEAIIRFIQSKHREWRE